MTPAPSGAKAGAQAATPNGAPRLTCIAPGVHFVERGWLNGNHFIATSPQLRLIDTGYKDDLETTIEVLRGLDAEPRDIELIVNTHCHCDHAGGNRRLQAESGCRIVMHEREKRRIEEGDDIGTWWRFHDTWAEPFPVHAGLAEGDELEFGPLSLRVVHAPGHSIGQIALYCREQRFLISADALWHGDLGVINPLVEGEDALERAGQTLERILSLDVAVVYPGHGGAITEPRPAALRCMRKLESYRKNELRMHEDHLRKMAAYVVLTKSRVHPDALYDQLMQQIWFTQLVDRYFDARPRPVYERILGEMLTLRMVKLEGGFLVGSGRR
jgi:glyoxylase-like metal-dependent hydrolase (beta-lactamase superfamily II)